MMLIFLIMFRSLFFIYRNRMDKERWCGILCYLLFQSNLHTMIPTLAVTCINLNYHLTANLHFFSLSSFIAQTVAYTFLSLLLDRICCCYHRLAIRHGDNKSITCPSDLVCCRNQVTSTICIKCARIRLASGSTGLSQHKHLKCYMLYTTSIPWRL